MMSGKLKISWSRHRRKGIDQCASEEKHGRGIENFRDAQKATSTDFFYAAPVFLELLRAYAKLRGQYILRN